jgi:hypothetical protein
MPGSGNVWVLYYIIKAVSEVTKSARRSRTNVWMDRTPEDINQNHVCDEIQTNSSSLAVPLANKVEQL